MTRLSIRLGFWSALLGAITFILFPICFIAILKTAPVFTWTNLPDYVAHVRQYDQTWKYLAQLAMLSFGPLYLLMLNSIHEYAPPEKKVLARASLCFGVIFAALTGMNYFLELSANRLNILAGQTQGLEQFVQGNPTSAIAAINMLGWTVFFGLSSVFAGPVFSGGRLERVIRYAFLANGIICLLGGAGYVLDIKALIFVSMNLGMGVSVLVVAAGLCILFRRLEKRLGQAEQVAIPAVSMTSR